jgi:hypothetical protein
MRQNLVVSVLGNRRSGKSHTWNTLFGKVVRTGSQMRRLYLTTTQYVEVFLVSGSPEERNSYVGDIIGNNTPRIVLCSLQYRQDVVQTIQYFVQHDYFLFVHWLNPGFSDPQQEPDSLGLIPTILGKESLLGVRDGRADADDRVGEMRDFIFGWASSRDLVRT